MGLSKCVDENQKAKRNGGLPRPDFIPRGSCRVAESLFFWDQQASVERGWGLLFILHIGRGHWLEDCMGGVRDRWIDGSG